MSSEAAAPAWLGAVVFRMVRSSEQAQGSMDDGEAFRAAASASREAPQRLAHRAWLLAERVDGLMPEIERWRALLPWLLLLLAGFVGWISWELLQAVAGGDRRINAMGALLTVLGLPSLSLLVWCLSLLWPASSNGGLTRVALGLAARLPGLRSPPGLGPLQAGLALLAQARLLPWVLGLANHLVWIGALLCILLGLLASFSFRAYALSWETTILSPGLFARWVDGLGWLPSQLGFPVPTVEAVSRTSLDLADQRAWAWWLIGCIVVYGVLPRVLAAAACLLVWRQRQGRIGQPDGSDAYTQDLLQRFARWDADTAQVLGAAPAKATRRAPVCLAAVVGFELPPEWAELPSWPEAEGAWHARIDGTASERRETLDRIAQTRPQRLLLVCHAAATPDRGTARFLKAALPAGVQGALLLLGSDEPGRWPAWLRREWPEGPVPLTDPAQAQAWLMGAQHA